MEAAGVEPASANAHLWSPTCLVSVLSHCPRYGDNLGQPASKNLVCSIEALAHTSLSFMTPSPVRRGPDRWGVAAFRQPLRIQCPQLLYEVRRINEETALGMHSRTTRSRRNRVAPVKIHHYYTTSTRNWPFFFSDRSGYHFTHILIVDNEREKKRPGAVT